MLAAGPEGVDAEAAPAAAMPGLTLRQERFLDSFAQRHRVSLHAHALRLLAALTTLNLASGVYRWLVTLLCLPQHISVLITGNAMSSISC